MNLALAERLVCPEAHEATPLVVRVDVLDDGRVRTGLLGCPLCLREWPVTDFIARFGTPASQPAMIALDAHAAAALLNLTTPGVIISDGVAADVTAALAGAYEATIIALEDDALDAALVVQGAARVPIAARAVAGAIMMRPGRSADFAASMADAVAPGGRVIVARGLPMDPRLQELARDESVVVLQREADTVRVQLRREPERD